VHDTSAGTGLTLVLAISYSSRWESLGAARGRPRKHYREIYSVVFPLTFCRQQADTDVIELNRFVSIVFEHFAVHFQGRQVHILRLFRHDDSRGESMSSEHDGKDQDDLFSPLPYLLVSGAVVLMTLLLRCLFCPGEQF
jgi:hypothetical protein